MSLIFRRAAGTVVALALSLGWLPATGAAETGSGAYLAGRQALFDSDFEQAALYYTRALVRDPTNPHLMESLALAQLALGRADRALPVAQQMESLGLRSQIAQMVIVAHLIETEKFEDLLSRDPETQGISPLVDGLLLAWSHMGTGAVSKALAQFDAVAEEKGLAGFALYHKAMARALVGDYEGAEAMFAEDDGKLTMISRRAALARVEILSQLGRNGDALDVISSVFGSNLDPGLEAVSERLGADQKLPFTQVTSVRDGMAEVFFTIGAALKGEAADDYALIYTRMAGVLRPDHIDALLLSAELLDALGQYELSVETYKLVPVGHPDYYAAELGRAEALRRAAKPDAAIEVLEKLARDYPSLPSVHSALGDLQRQQENYELAVTAYDNALKFSEPDGRSNWFILYARGISHERLKQWPQAEADFRAALELNPDQPQVLNYLGYSMVEKQINLDEALEMIERAVAARPDSGYIVDSLGWVLYRLGRYDEAVEHMEKAVELMPVDPVVNDHLGDVFWAVGRTLEAEFQWKRALSFIDPEDTDGEADPDRIRRKLEVGLDAVLAEEGAPPLRVANED